MRINRSLLAATVLLVGLAWPAPMLAQSNAQAQATTPAAAAPATPAAATANPATAPAAPNAAAATPAVSTFEYEVASIKRNTSGQMMPGFSPMGGDELKATNIPLEVLVVGAFGLMPNQISGQPDWLLSERYDINAKMDPATADALKKLSPDDRKTAQEHMIQALLADRCKLKFHRETKERSTYTLVVAKNGPKFHESKPGETVVGGRTGPDGRGGTMNVQINGTALSFSGAPMTVLVPMLSGMVGGTVVDKTGLTGKYDFSWQMVVPGMVVGGTGQLQSPAAGGPAGAGQNPAAAAPTPTGTRGFGLDPSALSAGLEDQLGLKLVSSKGPVTIIVIDHIERPSED